MNDIQKVILNIFKEFDRICQRHSIPYFAIGGTCIGAIRHKGFIPWDDDLDVAIPIEYFDRFMEIAANELPPYYELYSSKETKHYRYIFAKIIDSRTTFIERLETDYKDAYKGIYIDIMPLSGIPQKKVRKNKFSALQSYYYLMNNTLRYPIDHVLKGDNVSKSIWKYVYLYSKLTAKNKPFNYFTEKWLKMLRENPFERSELTGYVWMNRLGGLVFKTEYFGEPIRMQFEDTTILCPSNYHDYLTAQFGDYMTPPDIKDQATHIGFVDLEHSYNEYKNGIREYPKKEGEDSK